MQTYGWVSFYGAAALFYLADIIQKRGSQDNNTWTYIFYRSGYTSLITFLLALCFGDSLFALEWFLMFKMMACAFICSFGLFFYLESLKYTAFSNVGALSVVGNPLQWMVGVVFFNNEWKAWDIPIMLLLAVGSIIQIVQNKSFQGAKYVVLCSLSWTVGYSLLSDVIDQFPIHWSVFFLELALWVCSFCFVFFANGRRIPRWSMTPKVRGKLVLLGLVIFAASYTSHYSYKVNELTVISFFQLSLYPIVYWVSLKIFKERPTGVEWITFICGTLGLAGLAIKHVGVI